ncbi:hypothetical protein [Burkholderia ambifaria]|uniref:hypothetical protein n=2 Tax=Burkholderia cepacia complex TaxID=87882 RepID=UPI00158E1FAD|nr:hypothetical protein [Burkholderia ambifaria]
MAATSKLEVATELLTEALRIYLEGKAYFASLHLAGAAEEIFGRFVQDEGGVPAFHNMRDAALLFEKLCLEDDGEPAPSSGAAKAMADVINNAKNATKHGIADVDFDAKEEAQDLLDRAIDNYSSLQFRFKLPEIDQLHDYHNARYRKQAT